MGVWIRSQCKKWLINANKLWIVGTEIRATHQANGDGYFVMGAYPTEAEAMEVMDILDNQIEALEDYKCIGKDRGMPCPPFVFQMPPAGFSIEPEKFIPGCGADLNHCGLLDGTVSEEAVRCKSLDECELDAALGIKAKEAAHD